MVMIFSRSKRFNRLLPGKFIKHILTYHFLINRDVQIHHSPNWQQQETNYQAELEAAVLFGPQERRQDFDFLPEIRPCRAGIRPFLKQEMRHPVSNSCQNYTSAINPPWLRLATLNFTLTAMLSKATLFFCCFFSSSSFSLPGTMLYKAVDCIQKQDFDETRSKDSKKMWPREWHLALIEGTKIEIVNSRHFQLLDIDLILINGTRKWGIF